MIIGKTQPGGQTIPWYEINLNGQELYIRSDFVDIVSETKLESFNVGSRIRDSIRTKCFACWNLQ